MDQAREVLGHCGSSFLRDGARIDAEFCPCSGPRTDGVVAQRLDLMGFEGDSSELSVGYLEVPWVLLVDELGAHSEPCVRGGGAEGYCQVLRMRG